LTPMFTFLAMVSPWSNGPTASRNLFPNKRAGSSLR